MEEWFKLALIAAVFITLRDLYTTRIIKKYEFVNYIIYYNIIVFILTLMYMTYYKVPAIQPSFNDFIMILIRIAIIYLIIEPSIFKAIKESDNVGFVKSIIGLNTLFIFFISALSLKQQITLTKIIGIISVFLGTALIM